MYDLHTVLHNNIIQCINKTTHTPNLDHQLQNQRPSLDAI